MLSKTIKLFLLGLLILNVQASGAEAMATSKKLDIERFMGKWYVISGRFTWFEKGAHNSVETYTWNEKEKRIDVEFHYNQDSFTGKQKSMTQKAWIQNPEVNSHWKIQFLWPFKFDYLILDVDDDYSWTAVGVPDQSYLWIMSRSKTMDPKTYQEILESLHTMKYSLEDIEMVPHS